jgi:gliding motility-associated lipoprotein GldD
MKKYSILFLCFLALAACRNEEDQTPRPKGYFRIDMPTKEYQIFSPDCGYSFDLNKIAKPKGKGSCWYDIKYPPFKATLKLTYRRVTATNLDTLLGEGHELAYRHTVKADGIEEKLYLNEDKKVYGLLYQLKGDAASSLQFFATDSTNHFLRGVLYYYASPNADSLQPVNAYMRGELIQLIESLEWQNS